MEIRQVCIYNRNLKERYYVSNTGLCYTKCKDGRAMIDGVRRTITKHLIRQAMNGSDDFLIPFDDWGLKVILLHDGTILRLLKTFVRECNTVIVSMFDVDNVEKKLYVSRLIANAFVADVENKEVHHIDQDRTNNKSSNLAVLSFEDHRGVGNHNINHTKCRDYRNDSKNCNGVE